MDRLSSLNILNGSLENEEQPSQILEAQAHIWNQIFNFIKSGSLKCAIQLDIPDIISNHGCPMKLSELVAVLPIHPAKSFHVHRLMSVLVHSNIFGSQELGGDDGDENGYVLTPSSRLLVKDNPLSLAPYVMAALDPALTKPWHCFSSWFQNDDHTVFDTTHGMKFWEYAGNEPRLSGFFNEAMANDSRLISSVLVDKCTGVFEGLKSLVDVGGGTGTMAKAIVDAFPHLECIVFDLPHVVDSLKDDKNLKYVGGNMFEAIPPADAVFLKWILHNWSDQECMKILKQCKKAIISNKCGGKVIIIDMMVENQKHKDLTETQLLFDLEMMVLVAGKERNQKEWANLFKDAGFNHYKITPLLGLRSLIEIYP